jgi:hypothetical protein
LKSLRCFDAQRPRRIFSLSFKRVQYNARYRSKNRPAPQAFCSTWHLWPPFSSLRRTSVYSSSRINSKPMSSSFIFLSSLNFSSFVVDRQSSASILYSPCPWLILGSAPSFLLKCWSLFNALRQAFSFFSSPRFALSSKKLNSSSSALY